MFSWTVPTLKRSLKTTACFYNDFLLIIVLPIFTVKASPLPLRDSNFPFALASLWQLHI